MAEAGGRRPEAVRRETGTRIPFNHEWCRLTSLTSAHSTALPRSPHFSRCRPQDRRSRIADPLSYSETTWNHARTMTETNALGYPKLQPKKPVPSDIEVSQSIVKEVGLLPIEDVAKQ